MPYIDAPILPACVACASRPGPTSAGLGVVKPSTRRVSLNGPSFTRRRTYYRAGRNASQRTGGPNAAPKKKGAENTNGHAGVTA